MTSYLRCATTLAGRRNPRKLLDNYGRLRTVAVAPDGSLWVTTSNRDQVGREDRLPQTPNGDIILRVTPP